ncbi:MAG TPA: hypothetical protein VGM90_14220 [Kofleriaceae bacterium]|jgi:hypothetical protein
MNARAVSPAYPVARKLSALALPLAAALAFAGFAALSTGCVEDSLLGTQGTPLAMARGLTRDVAIPSNGAPASSWLLDVDDPSIARLTFAPDGRFAAVTALAEGTTTIHLAFRETAIHILTTVTPAQIASLTLSPPDVTATLGSTVAVSALGTNTADELVDATSLVTWTVDDPIVARVSPDGVHGMAPGHTLVHASVDGIASSASVDVAPAQ